MRITEKVLVILFLIGFVMLLGQAPFGLVVTTFSSIFVAILYTLFGFALFNDISFKGIFNRASYHGVWTGSFIIAAVSGIILGASVITILFNAAHWPGAGMFRFYVLLPSGAICIMSIVLSILKEPIGKPILIRSLPVFLFVLYYLYKYNLSYMM